MLHQISGSLFTLEEAKGHGLGADQGWRGKDWASPLPPHSEPWEGSGSRPGVLLQAQAGADLAELTVEPSSCFLLCSGWMPGCRGLWLWECVAFPAAPRAVFSSSFALPPPSQAAPLAPPAALARLSGQLQVRSPLFQARPPRQKPSGWGLAAGTHSACRKPLLEGLADPCFLL